MSSQAPATRRATICGAGFSLCAAIAALSITRINADGIWFLALAPSALCGLHLLGECLKALGVPVRNSNGTYQVFHRHPNEGLVNPATGLFIGSGGVDALGYGFGAGPPHSGTHQ